MGRTVVPLLPPDSCRWSRYPFDLPFPSSLGNFLGSVFEVGKFVFLDVSEVLIWINSWFWKLFHGHAVSLVFAGMKCALYHWEDWIWEESCCSIKIEYNLTDGEETKRSKCEVKNASVCFKILKINKQTNAVLNPNKFSWIFKDVEQLFWRLLAKPF